MKILEINKLKKSFDGKTVIEDISLSVEEGEVVSIIGPSGSGKTTLLRCATFLETMDSGELSYCEKKFITNKNYNLLELFYNYENKKFKIEPYGPDLSFLELLIQ